MSPTEVEEAIATHPDVVEVAVVAVPSELTEDEVKAFVVAAPGPQLDFEELAPGPGSGCPRSRFPGSGRPWTHSPAPRRPGWPSTGFRWGTRPMSTTPQPDVRGCDARY